MSCGQSNYSAIHSPFGYSASEPSTPSTSGPHLVLSNSPESIDLKSGQTALPRTLYKAEIPISTTSKRFRLFLWHTNNLGISAKFGTIVSTDDGTSGSITNIEQQKGASTSGGLASLGICCAKAQLYDTYDSYPGSCTLSGTEVVFTSDTVSDGYTIGIVMEFDVSANSSCNLRIRTAVWDGPGNVVPGSWSTTVETAESAHPRGWWPFSNLTIPCGTFDANPNSGPLNKQITCCSDSGPEEDAFATTSGDTYGKTNEGLYGVNLRYDVDVSCTGQYDGIVYATVIAQNTGSNYFGAGDVVSWDNRQDRGIPPIHWANPNNSDSYANVVDLTIDGGLGITHGSDEDFQAQIANAGAATMPFLLVLSKQAFEAIEPEEGGDG